MLGFESVWTAIEEYQVDGLRWDATAYIRNADGDDNNPSANIRDGWRLVVEINAEVKARCPSAIIIPEDLQANEWLTKDTSLGAAGFDSQWDAVFVHPVRHALCAEEDKDRSMIAVRDALTYRYNNSAIERVIYTESHDEVANGSSQIPEEVAAKRGCQIMARKLATLGAAILFTSPGIPMVFQGQEFIDTGRFDDLAPLDWKNVEANDGTINLFKDLIQLRRNVAGNTVGLSGEGIDVFYLNEKDKIMIYRRWHHDHPDSHVVVVLNFSGREQVDHPLNLPDAGNWQAAFDSDRTDYEDDHSDIGSGATKPVTVFAGGNNHRIQINLAAYSVLILTKK